MVANAATTSDLTALSLEELMTIEVTSASKKSEELRDVAAAVTVITAEDIAMSPALTIPDLLRTVPGVQVAKIDSQTWAISARGFNDFIANKLLVLVDGRSIYSNIFSGTFWDIHQVPLDTIDRIEVIRGPGATLWGANAVNGVINIITKSADDMQGTSISFGAGNEERANTLVSHGGAVGEDLKYRGYLNYFDRDGAVDADGVDLSGDWWEGRGGTRIDWDASARDRIEFQGDIAQGQTEVNLKRRSLTVPYNSTENTGRRYNTANLSTNWTRSLGEDHEFSLSGYWNYWYVQRIERHQTFDLDFQHRFQANSWNEVTWGLGYRLFETDPAADNDIFSTSIGSQIDHLVSGFVQDRIPFVSDELDLTVGSKFEFNTLSGFEYQPSARLRWQANSSLMFWGAVSRAVRTPSVAEQTATFTNTVLGPGEDGNTSPLPLQVVTITNPDFKTETLLTYELGGRFRVGTWATFEPALFYNVYDNLISSESLRTTIDATSITTSFTTDNKLSGESFGFELAGIFVPSENWTIRASYSYLNLDMRADPDSDSINSAPLLEGSNPRHQATLTNTVRLLPTLRASVGVRFVDNLPVQDTDLYVGMDAKLVWEPIDAVEVSLSGRDLLQARHKEFEGESFSLTEGSEVQRSVFGRVKVRF